MRLAPSEDRRIAFRTRRPSRSSSPDTPYRFLRNAKPFLVEQITHFISFGFSFEFAFVRGLTRQPSPPCGFRSRISFVTVLIFLRAGFIGKGNEAVDVCNRTIHLSRRIRKYFGDMRSGDLKCVAMLFACTFQSHAHSE